MYLDTNCRLGSFPGARCIIDRFKGRDVEFMNDLSDDLVYDLVDDVTSRHDNRLPRDRIRPTNLECLKSVIYAERISV